MATLTATFEETIENLLDQKKYNSVRDLLTVLQPPDLALLMEEMPDNSTVLLLNDSLS